MTMRYVRIEATRATCFADAKLKRFSAAYISIVVKHMSIIVRHGYTSAV